MDDSQPMDLHFDSEASLGISMKNMPFCFNNEKRHARCAVTVRFSRPGKPSVWDCRGLAVLLRVPSWP
jgi:hypothetical protein